MCSPANESCTPVLPQLKHSNRRRNMRRMMRTREEAHLNTHPTHPNRFRRTLLSAAYSHYRRENKKAKIKAISRSLQRDGPAKISTWRRLRWRLGGFLEGLREIAAEWLGEPLELLTGVVTYGLPELEIKTVAEHTRICIGLWSRNATYSEI